MDIVQKSIKPNFVDNNRSQDKKLIKFTKNYVHFSNSFTFNLRTTNVG